MGKPSRDKGKRGERQVVDLARAAGHSAAARDWATPQLRGDVSGIEVPEWLADGVHLEARWREQPRVPAWVREVEDVAEPGQLAVVAWRTRRQPWRADVDLAALLRLLKGPS